MQNNCLVSSELINTGGGCMVYFVDLIIDHSNITIGIDGEYIVGYSKRYQEIEGDPLDYLIWQTNSWRELIEYTGQALAIDVYIQFHKHWKYTDHIEDSSAVNGFIKLVDFATAASQLYDAVQENEMLLVGYPFKKDFEEVLIEIYNWQQVVLDKFRV